MTHDLATRIADGRKKAETFNEATTITALMRDGRAFQDAASPSLFIEMADEIDRLKAQLEKARAEIESMEEDLDRLRDERDAARESRE